jgi:hypothetical protein
MKLSINKHEGYANTPEFVIDFGDIKFDAPLVVPFGTNGDAWYLAFTYDLSVLNYRLLCEHRINGNTNYGYPEGGYDSGWSSRASVINKQLGYHYVDVSQRGIELDKLLYLVHDKYVGDVFLARRENATDVEYCVEPYFKDQHDNYYTKCNYIILHTADPDFIEKAMMHLTHSKDMYVAM